MQMKKKYEKPEIVSEKMDLNLLHTACSGGNNTSSNMWPQNPLFPVCDPVSCSDLGTAFTNHEG